MKRILLFVVLGMLFTACKERSSVDFDLLPFREDVGKGHTIVYIDKKGNRAVVPKIPAYGASMFYDGLAIISRDEIVVEGLWRGGYRYINREGEPLWDKMFADAQAPSEGLVWTVLYLDYPIARDYEGNVVLEMKDAESIGRFIEGLAPYAEKDSNGEICWGFINKKGEVVIPLNYKYVSHFLDGRAVFSKDGKRYGIIDKDGEVILPDDYTDIDLYSDGYSVVSVLGSDEYGVLDSKGNFIINPQYHNIIPDGKGLFLVEDEDGFGWIDKKGKVHIQPELFLALPFNKLAYTSFMDDDYRFGLLNKKGEEILKPQFEMILPYDKNLAIAALGEYFGLIDKQGVIKVTPKYFLDEEDDLVRQLTSGTTAHEYVHTRYVDFKEMADLFTTSNAVDEFRGLSAKTTFSDIGEMVDNVKYHSPESRIVENKEPIGNEGLVLENTCYYSSVPLGDSDYLHYGREYRGTKNNGATLSKVKYSFNFGSHWIGYIDYLIDPIVERLLQLYPNSTKRVYDNGVEVESDNIIFTILEDDCLVYCMEVTVSFKTP